MAIDLLLVRRRLSLRYGQFSFLLIAVFAGSIYAAVADARADITRNQVRQLAATAAAELPLRRRAIESPGPASGAGPHAAAANSSVANPSAAIPPALLTPQEHAAATTLRLQWWDPALRPLGSFGGYQPREALLPPLAQRATSHLRPLADGLAFWQPVLRRSPASGALELQGYVAVALATRSADDGLLCLRQGLVVGTVLAALVALIGGRSLVAAALEPLQGQVEHLARFSADASHELRHPLTAVRSLIGSLRHGSALIGASPQLVAKLVLIDHTTVRMGQLVDDLLLLARSERPLEHQALRRFPPEELIDDLTSLYAPAAQQRGVRLTSQVGWGGELRGHPERLRQLLVNLISNALRFSPPGGTVTVGLDSQGSTVQIWVDDQGPGIPLDLRQQVFEPFWHGEGAKENGTGLGLAIARAIALAHGGRLEVAEAPGGGCRMLLGLPQHV